jgi:hypothetical protein
MEIPIQLDSQHAAQLEYIQKHSHLDTAALIALTIEREYQQLQPTDELTLNPLSRSSFVGCFQGSPDLATNSKSIFNEIMAEKFPSLESPAS